MEELECPACGSRNVININLTLEEGQPASFYSCHNCERRWWHDAEGRVIDLPEVLDRARRTGRGATAKQQQR